MISSGNAMRTRHEIGLVLKLTALLLTIWSATVFSSHAEIQNDLSKVSYDIRVRLGSHSEDTVLIWLDLKGPSSFEEISL